MQAINPKDVFADRYRLLKRIAQGPFSESWLASNEAVGSKQVLKIYNSLDEKGCKAFRREFERAHHLTHARLVRPIDFDVYGDRPYLSLPHFRRGSTARLAGKLSEKEIARIMRDVGGALAFIHQPAYNIVHRDIRPENILLDDEGYYMLNIFDIGTALQNEFHGRASRGGAALSEGAVVDWRPYQAPEYFDKGGGRPVTAAADIWALGAALFELAAGEPPFGQTGGESQLQGQPSPRLPSRFSGPLSIALKQCLAESPAARPSAEGLRAMAIAYLNAGQWPVQHPNNKSRNPDGGGWARVGKIYYRRAKIAFNLFRRRVRLWKPSFGRMGFAFNSLKKGTAMPKLPRGRIKAAFTSLRTIGVALTDRWAGMRQTRYRRIGVFFLVGLFMAAGVFLTWPQWEAGKGLAENSKSIPDTHRRQPINQKPFLEEKRPAAGAEVEKRAVNNPDSGSPAEALSGDISESIYTFPPAVPPKREAPPPSKKQPAPPARESEKALPEPAPPPKRNTAEAREKEQPAKPGAEAKPPTPRAGTESEEPIKPKLNGLTQKWGYVDKSGTWMIWPQFEEASPFENGRARVVIKVGNEVLRPYHLDPSGYLTPITETEEGGSGNN